MDSAPRTKGPPDVSIHPPIDKTKQQIRLLSFCETDNDNDIACKLSVFDLEACPRFLALSYVWGPPDDGHTITLNGEAFNVRRNLFLALKNIKTRVRSAEKEDPSDHSLQNIKTRVRGAGTQDLRDHSPGNTSGTDHLRRRTARLGKTKAAVARSCGILWSKIKAHVCCAATESSNAPSPDAPSETNHLEQRELARPEQLEAEHTLSLEEVKQLLSRYEVGCTKKHRIFLPKDYQDSCPVLSPEHEIVDFFRKVPELPSLFWIDAICIDQSNIAERNHQVSRMREIYSKASLVLVWLGLDCEQSLRYIQAMQKVDYEIFEHIQRRDPWHVTEAPATLALRRNPYWARLWTLQEFTLAQELILASGTTFIHWDQAYPVLWNDRGPNFDPAAINRVINIRGSLRSWSVVEGPSLSDFIENVRGLGCSEIRDRLFGIYGLVREGRCGILTVDYSLTPLELSMLVLRTLYSGRLLRSLSPKQRLMALRMTPPIADMGEEFYERIIEILWAPGERQAVAKATERERRHLYRDHLKMEIIGIARDWVRYGTACRPSHVKSNGRSYDTAPGYSGYDDFVRNALFGAC